MATEVFGSYRLINSVNGALTETGQRVHAYVGVKKALTDQNDPESSLFAVSGDYRQKLIVSERELGDLLNLPRDVEARERRTRGLDNCLKLIGYPDFKTINR